MVRYLLSLRSQDRRLRLLPSKRRLRPASIVIEGEGPGKLKKNSPVTKQLRTITVATVVFSLLLASIAYACSGRDFMKSSGTHASMGETTVKKDPCGETKADVCKSVRRNMLSIQALQSPWNAPAQFFTLERLLPAEAPSPEGILRSAARLRTFFHPTPKLSFPIFYLELRI